MKIFCIGRNYVAHAKELNNKVPTQPLVFMKPQTALTYSEKVKYPSFSKDVHYEIEVVLHLSKGGHNIPLTKAGNYYNAIGLGIDYTARDVQARCKKKGHPWEMAKGYDNSATLSASYSQKDYKMDNLSFALDLNGQRVQAGNTKQLIFKFDYLIHYLSNIFTLEEGDVIYTGTPAGVGPVKPGDQLRAYLEGNLVLENYIIS